MGLLISGLEGLRRRRMALPGNAGIPLGALAVLAALILLTFLPLFAGYNFLPFAKYPNWGWADARNNGVPLDVDGAFIARKRAIPWVSDMDFGHLSGFFPGDFYTAERLRGGAFLCGIPTPAVATRPSISAQYRPFNPLRWPFYVFPTYWTYCLTLALGIPLGAWGALLWLKREGYGLPEATLGAALFAVNPWVIDRLTIQDPPAFSCFPGPYWLFIGCGGGISAA